MAGTEGFDAADVARKEFATGFRGFDQYEVRAYLARLAAEMGVLQERDRGLRERLGELERKRPSDRVLADEEIEAALGVEATKVIHAAREAGAEIRAKAEENVARLLREAQDESQAMRSEASGLLAVRTEEAEAAATQIVESAQQRGREMVVEAQAVRERMLRDLARRRRHAEAQVQLLLDGRERLAAALDRAGQVVGEANEQLSAVELTDLPPLDSSVGSPPVTAGSPVVVPEPVTAVPPVLSVPPTPLAVPPLVAEPTGSLRLLRRRVESDSVALEDDVEGVRVLRHEFPAASVEEATAGASVSDEVAPAPTPTEVEPVEAVQGAEGAEGAEGDEGQPAPGSTPVEDLFARLRADRATVEGPDTEAPEGQVVASEGHGTAGAVGATSEQPTSDDAATDAVPTNEPRGETGEVDAAFEARDAALESAERALARSLKRALADEQNEVLDALRRLKGTPRIEVLLPAGSVHRARYQRVAEGPLASAAAVGGATPGGLSIDGLAGGFADEVSNDLRARVERALDAGTTDPEALVEAISAGYREWKTARSEDAARHHAVAAYNAAVYATAPDGELVWVVDPTEGGCPDCDDNALAGPTPKGTPFPTGQLHPPAHVGCRCLVHPVP